MIKTCKVLKTYVFNDYDEFDVSDFSKKICEYYDAHEGLKQDKTYEAFLYELVGYLRKDLIGTIQDIENSNLYDWGASVFNKNKEARKDALNKVTFKPVAIKGLDFCRVCKGDEFTYWQAQTRGNDEQTTTFKRCVKCNFT